ncbi:hypothetical protein [Haladaptatus halobius]|jgi:hypothetical protein|uniref:hypothetical protein n=1 Tax=Haladaptatus halobius TaxID=2884875 RepID=UPI001D09E971|nr:hypothetical protein [Haladaptatus halobius]
MEGTHEEELPQRFDDRIILEIEDGADRDRPLVRMRDSSDDGAWVASSIDAVVSLSEYR